MTRRAYLYFVLTFLLGALVGGAVVFSYGWYRGRWHRGANKERIVRRMTRELNLTSAQAQQLSEIMDASIKKHAELREQFGPQFKAIRDETNDRIRQILTPEQVTKFNEMVRRFEARIRQRSP